MRARRRPRSSPPPTPSTRLLNVNAPVTPQQARALRRRRQHERQAVVFGIIIACLALTGVAGLAVYTGALALPGRPEFVAKEATSVSTIVGAQPCVPPDTTPVGRKKIKVTVLNGSSVGGLAGVVADMLSERGFKIEGTGNDKRMPSETLISFGPEGVAQAYTLAAHLPAARLVLDAREGKTVDLTLTADATTLVPEDQVLLDPDTPLEPVPGCAEIETITPQPAPARLSATASPSA